MSVHAVLGSGNSAVSVSVFSATIRPSVSTAACSGATVLLEILSACSGAMVLVENSSAITPVCLRHKPKNICSNSCSVPIFEICLSRSGEILFRISVSTSSFKSKIIDPT